MKCNFRYTKIQQVGFRVFNLVEWIRLYLSALAHCTTADTAISMSLFFFNL